MSKGTDCNDTLVQALQAGSAIAFRNLFDKFHKKIFFVSKKMGLSAEDAEGVVQEVFLLIWEKRHTLRPDLSINAFLLTLTKRIVIKKIRYHLVSYKHLEEVFHRVSDCVNTEDSIIFNDLEAFALDYIDGMPAARKEIFLLSKREGLSNDEIAQQLQVSKRTVENQLYRAIKSIKTHLQKESYLPPTVLLVLLACVFY